MELVIHCTMFIVFITIQSVAFCRPSISTGTPSHIILQDDLLKLDLANGKLNVSNRRKLRLYSPKSNKYLQIKEKVVNAKGDSTSKYADLIIESVGYNLIRIKGEHTGNYVCFDPRTSKLKSRKNGDKTACIFREKSAEATGRTIYTSFIHPDWYIGIKNNGKARPGNVPKKQETKHNNTYEFTTIVKHRHHPKRH